MDYAIGPPPQGGDRNRASEILALDGAIFGISWSMVFLRIFTRTWITRNLGWDEATIVLAAPTPPLTHFLRPYNYSLEVNFGIIAACLPIMKPFYNYIHGLFTGSPTTLGRHHRRHHHHPLAGHYPPDHTYSSATSSHHGLWHRLRSFRSTTKTTLALPPSDNNHDHDDGNDDGKGLRVGGGGGVGTTSIESVRMPERASRSMELPIQGGGIEKKVEFGFVEGGRRGGVDLKQCRP
ncbi:hypothetical protein Q9189_001734 [Teloschistes chrysophthalmus]